MKARAAEGAARVPEVGTAVSAVPAVPVRVSAPPISVPPRSVVKRIVDVLIAGATLVVLSPVLVVVSLLVLCTSRGPALILQERVGRDGRLFRMVKFRTMVNGAETQREEIIGPPDEGILERYSDDPRITGMGRLLRRWSIDELPQLLNVLVGSMSVVGPRPILPEELPYLTPEAERRHCVRPGLTGLWQVSGRKSVHWADRMRLDVRYVDEWSPRLDTVILLRTLRAVLAGDGAL